MSFTARHGRNLLSSPSNQWSGSAKRQHGETPDTFKWAAPVSCPTTTTATPVFKTVLWGQFDCYKYLWRGWLVEEEVKFWRGSGVVVVLCCGKKWPVPEKNPPRGTLWVEWWRRDGESLGKNIKSKFEFTLIGIIFDQPMSAPATAN